MKKSYVFGLVIVLMTSCSIQQRVVEIDPSRQDMHLLWVQNNTPLPNYPTGRKLKSNLDVGLKPKWYVPQQSPNGMVTPQFRYQSNNVGFGFNGPGAFQRGY